MKYYCDLPRAILDRAGAILCVPVRSALAADGGNDVRRAILCTLREDPALLMVLYSEEKTEDSIEAVRLQMPENMRCRVIGRIVGPSNVSTREAYKKWCNLYAPKIPFAELDSSMVQQISMIKGNHNSRRGRRELADKTRAVIGLPISAIATDSLVPAEIVALSVEAYAHGLLSFSHALIQPLLDKAGLSESSNNRNFSYELIHGRTSADRFGELCRSLNIRLQVNFSSIDAHSESHFVDAN